MNKDLDVSWKKRYNWQVSIWRKAQHLILSGNCKLKLQWDPTRKDRSKTLTAPSAGEVVGQQELSFMLVEIQIVWLLWKTFKWFFTKVNMILSCNPATSLLRIYPRSWKCVYTKNWHRNRSFIENYKNSEVIKITF